MASFIYSSMIRVGEEPQSHRKGSKVFIWYDRAAELWESIDWHRVYSIIQSQCHGTTRGATIIEKTMEILDKYVGKNGQKTLDPNDAKYLAGPLTNELIQTLNEVNLGSSGTALSLLNYSLGSTVVATAQNAGFSFESRLSEFIQRLAGNFIGPTEEEAREALRSGGSFTSVGNSNVAHVGFYVGSQNKADKENLINIFKKEAEAIGSSFKAHAYKEIVTKLENGLDRVDVFLVGYKVPQKADITVPDNLHIHMQFGPLVGHFLQEIQGKKLSLKNTSKGEEIKLGSTKDITRLRGFINEFERRIKKDFGSTCTFIYASKASGKKNSEVQRYIDWARVLYELLGTGQHINAGDNLLVDYLIVNNYNSQGSGSDLSVFNVKDLIPRFPEAPYNPPFIIQGTNNEGPVLLDLGNAIKFKFG